MNASNIGYMIIIGVMLLLILVLCSCESEHLCYKKWDGNDFRCQTPDETCQEHEDLCEK